MFYEKFMRKNAKINQKIGKYCQNNWFTITLYGAILKFFKKEGIIIKITVLRFYKIC